MKVTKIVREYITETVNNKYQPLIDAVNEKYAGCEDKVAEIKEQTRKELNEMVRKVFRERLAPFYTEEALETLMGERYLVDSPSSWRVCTTEAQKRNDETEKLTNERDTAIKNILITLELGGTKADLDRLLSEINPTAEV